MEYVYAALLLHNIGKPVNEENLTSVLTSAGITADVARVKALVASLEGVNIDEAIKTAPALMVAPAAAAPAGEAKPEAKKEEKKPEEDEKKKEEAALEGLGALFG
jgi:large subunit ribosomal protein L12